MKVRDKNKVKQELEKSIDLETPHIKGVNKNGSLLALSLNIYKTIHLAIFFLTDPV